MNTITGLLLIISAVLSALLGSFLSLLCGYLVVQVDKSGIFSLLTVFVSFYFFYRGSLRILSFIFDELGIIDALGRRRGNLHYPSDWLSGDLASFITSVIGLLVFFLAWLQLFPAIWLDDTVISVTPTRISTIPTSTIMLTATPLSVDSSVSTPALATPQSRLELTYPLEMVVDKDDVITLEIIVDPNFTQLDTHSMFVTGIISVASSSQDGKREAVEDSIRFYPIMMAELITSGFDIIEGDSDIKRVITPSDRSIVWTWSVIAHEAGMHKFTINIFGENTVNNEKYVVLADSKTLNINVLDRPLGNRVGNILLNNLPTILGTSGLLGIAIAYLNYKSSQDKQKVQKQMDDLVETIMELKKSQKQIDDLIETITELKKSQDSKELKNLETEQQIAELIRNVSKLKELKGINALSELRELKVRLVELEAYPFKRKDKLEELTKTVGTLEAKLLEIEAKSKNTPATSRRKKKEE